MRKCEYLCEMNEERQMELSGILAEDKINKQEYYINNSFL